MSSSSVRICDRPRSGQMGSNLQIKLDADDWTAKRVIKLLILDCGADYCSLERQLTSAVFFLSAPFFFSLFAQVSHIANIKNVIKLMTFSYVIRSNINI